jgi:hypothetical protein
VLRVRPQWSRRRTGGLLEEAEAQCMVCALKACLAHARLPAMVGGISRVGMHKGEISPEARAELKWMSSPPGAETAEVIWADLGDLSIISCDWRGGCGSATVMAPVPA